MTAVEAQMKTLALSKWRANHLKLMATKPTIRTTPTSVAESAHVELPRLLAQRTKAGRGGETSDPDVRPC